MRYLKSRGKRKDNGAWVYGSLVILKHSNFIETFIIPDWSNADIYDEAAKFRHCYEVIPETVGQFVGLLDKNGKGEEVYENDIVLCSISQTQHYKGVIKYEAPSFFLQCFWEKQDAIGEICKGYELSYSLENGSKIILEQDSIDEILGNIFEHLYLLEEESLGYSKLRKELEGMKNEDK